MKIMGFNIGQYGDLAMNTVACSVMKKKYPNCHISFAISKKYFDCHEAFLHNKLIDNIFYIEGYDNFPTSQDIQNIKNENFDIIFNPMPQHKDPYWFLRRHQTQEVCEMHNISIPEKNEDLQIKLNKYWDDIEKYKNFVAIAPYGSFGAIKSLSEQKIQKIVSFLKKEGFKILLVKAKNQPVVENIDETTEGSYFDSIKKVSSSKMFITVDTGMNWFMSGYNMNTVGLYGYNFYPYCDTSKNWQPINKNASFLEAKHCNEIEENLILKTIKKHLEK